jgi:cytochrome c
VPRADLARRRIACRDADAESGGNPVKVARLACALASCAMALPALAQEALAEKSGCLACHAVGRKVVGPAYKDVAGKYRNDQAAEAKLVDKVKKGGMGVWGEVMMPPQPVSDADAHALVRWILSLK